MIDGEKKVHILVRSSSLKENQQEQNGERSYMGFKPSTDILRFSTKGDSVVHERLYREVEQGKADLSDKETHNEVEIIDETLREVEQCNSDLSDTETHEVEIIDETFREVEQCKGDLSDKETHTVEIIDETLREVEQCKGDLSDKETHKEVEIIDETLREVEQCKGDLSDKETHKEAEIIDNLDDPYKTDTPEPLDQYFIEIGCHNENVLKCPDDDQQNQQSVIIEEALICTICEKIIPNESLFEEHIMLHNEEQYDKESEMGSQVLQSEEKVIEKVVPSNICNEESLTQILLAGCKTSLKAIPYRSQSRSKVYVKKPKKEKKCFKCEICNKEFKMNSRLTEHLRVHTGEYKCDVCGKLLSSKKNLLYHQRTFHTGEKERETCFKCKFCSKEFKMNSLLVEHLRVHTGEKTSICDICGKLFSSKNCLSGHQKTVHIGRKPFQCSFCEKRFARNYVYLEHLRIHTGDTSFICDICGKGFRRKPYLQRHLFVHTGEKPHTCDKCGKSFYLFSNLHAHLKTHHINRKHGCPTCGKLISEMNMKRHQRIHTGVKPYACDKCGKTFTRSFDMKKHRKLHDRGKGYKSKGINIAVDKGE